MVFYEAVVVGEVFLAAEKRTSLMDFLWSSSSLIISSSADVSSSNPRFSSFCDTFFDMDNDSNPPSFVADVDVANVVVVTINVSV